MNKDKKEQKRLSKTVPARFGEDAMRFSAYNPMQQERILTNMHTIGTKQEMRRFDASERNPDTGMKDTL
ncbi:MAG: hypothetical protein IJF04_06620 [Oscillospiraceae bacterium]|nr:hypothetical protein [Oscillospiraceae bacterium]